MSAIEAGGCAPPVHEQPATAMSVVLTDYTALCAAHDAIRSAANLPERFRAVLHYHGALARFVSHYPTVLRLGIEALVRDEALAAVRELA